MRKIYADETVDILNIKNRFDLNYDSAASAGYRNVSISMVLVDQYTMQHSVDGHICELQLGLQPIHDIRDAATDEVDAAGNHTTGHQRYVQWRDALAV